MTSEDLVATLRGFIGSQGPVQAARHAVNTAAIADWCDAIGDDNPIYTSETAAAKTVHGGIVAPPATLDIWDRAGLPAQAAAAKGGDDPRSKVLRMLEAAGYVGVVAVNSELEIIRYLRPGDMVQNVQSLEEVSDEKQTALGIGHFVTTRHRYTTDRGEHVGDLLFRILKFKPGTGTAPPATSDKPTPPDPSPELRPRPAINRDNAMLWEGHRRHELRIPKCNACGTLTYPPLPRCASCGAFDMGYLVASGRGTVYAAVAVHYPQVPGFRYPLSVAVIELDEGVRFVSNIVGVPPDQVRIGMRVEVEWLDSHPALVDGATDSRGAQSLPLFRPATPDRRTETLAAGAVTPDSALPIWVLPVTPTRIVAGALATRDFQDVHHDRDLAHKKGSKDIFLNINTSLGLMQRYVTDWAGPEALVKALRVKLGAPAYPYSPLTFSGSVQSADPATGAVTVSVIASNDLGRHVAGTVEIELPPMTRHSYSGKAAIVGIGATEFSKASGRSELQLALEACAAACADAGVETSQVNGLTTFTMDTNPETEIMRGLGIGELTHFSRIPFGGGAPCATVQYAAMAVATGVADFVLCYRAFNERSGRRFGSGVQDRSTGATADEAQFAWSSPYGLLTPASWVAMFASRMMHEYGVTSEDFGRIAVADRKHAATNPAAFFYEQPITLEDHQASRWIVEPLHLLDCCQETDGGQAFLVTTVDRARDLDKAPVIVEAAAQGMADDQHMMRSFFRESIVGLPEMGTCARQIWETSGLGPADVATAVLYDHFTPFVLAQLEEFGFCGPGEAKDFIADGAIEIGGRLPVNTHGGQLGEAYLHGMNGVAEGVRQVRGSAVNQVENVEHVLVTGGTGVPTSAVMLGKDR